MSRIISQNPDFSPRKELLQPNTGIANAVDFTATTHDSPLATPQPADVAEQEQQAYDADFESLHSGLSSLFSQLADATADTDDSATNLSENSDKNSMSGACNSTANSAKDGVSSTSTTSATNAANAAPSSANFSATDSAANATGNAVVNDGVPKAVYCVPAAAAEFPSSNANATAPTAAKPNADAKSYGKFANAQELYKGYVQLEKSYTHKCQQLSQTLKTLQNLSSLSQTNSIPTRPSSSPTGGTSENSPPPALSPAVTVSDSSKSTESHGNGATLLDALTTLQQLLAHLPEVASVLQHKGVSTNRAPAVIGGGGAVTVAAPSKPKTVSQASALAHELLK